MAGLRPQKDGQKNKPLMNGDCRVLKGGFAAETPLYKYKIKKLFLKGVLGDNVPLK